MKRVKNIKYIFMLVLIMTLAYPLNHANAVNGQQLPYTPKIGKAIEHNCANLKNTLKELRKRDISSRVARVYVYEFLLVRTQAFATRLSNNKLNDKLVVADNQALQGSLDKFKSDYNNYDNNLTKLIASDCNQPTELYNNLQTSRQARKKLANDIKKIEKHWHQITSDISSVKLNNNQNKANKQ